MPKENDNQGGFIVGFLLVILWISFWLTWGLVVAVSGFAVIIALLAFRASLKFQLITLTLLSAGLVFVFWDLNIRPKEFFNSSISMFKFAIKNFQSFKAFWLNPMAYEGQSWAFHVVYGAWHGSIIAVSICYLNYMHSISPRGVLSRQKKQIKDQEKALKNGSFKKEMGLFDKGKVEKAVKNADFASVLGLDSARRVVEISDKEANTHTLIVGTTGSGKTVSVLNLVESFVRRGLPVLYVDGKGDRKLGEKIVGFANESGNGGRLFSMVGYSESYNPLRSGSYTSKKDRLIEVREWSEPHYRKLAEGYLQMVFSVLLECGLEVGVVELADILSRDRLISLVRENIETLGEEKAQQLIALIDEQHKAEKHIEGIAAEIRNLARSERGWLLNKNGMSLSEVLKAGQAVYMGLNPLQFPALADLLGKLIINDLKSTLDPSNETKMLIVFDEFGVFAGDQVLNVINQGRSAGVCAVLTVQSLSDIGRKIEKNPNHFIDQVFSNCNNYLIHRVNSADNAEELAKIIGTKTDYQITAQLGIDGATGTGSVRNTRAFIVSPDRLKTLRTGEAVFLSRNTGKIAEIQARKGQIA